MRSNASHFDNFDPDGFDDDVQSDLYDPDNATGAAPSASAATRVKSARPGQKLQLNISIANPTAKNLLVELFSALDSVTTRLKPEYVNAPYLMHPATSIEGISRIAAASGGIAGFNESGNLEIQGAAGDPKLQVGCGEYPYASLFESTKQLPFNVAYLRYTVSTDDQIDNNIYHFARTFGGGVKENTISPRAYFKPNQFQGKTIDIIAPFTIDGEKGLRLQVNAGENLRLAFFIQRWTKNNV
jgi:hypothetical protein